MPLSIADLALAREITAGLLDELGLDAYLFEVEPRDEQWEIKVECAITAEGAWESVALLVPKEILLTSRDDASARQHILAEWRSRLAACKLRP